MGKYLRLADILPSTRKNINNEVIEKYSLLHKIVDYNIHTCILLFGDAKAGKTRLAAYEAAVLARALDTSFEYLVTEPNWSDYDTENVIAAAALMNVPCTIRIFYTLNDAEDFVKTLFTGKSIASSKNVGKVFVIDSMTALRAMISRDVEGTSHLPLLGQSSIIPDKIAGNIRRYAGIVGGYVLFIAHMTYHPSGPTWRGYRVSPRFAKKVLHYTDAEVYVDVQGPGKGVMKVLIARRFKNRDTIQYVIEEKVVTAKGKIEYYTKKIGEYSIVTTVRFTPDTAGEEYEFHGLLPLTPEEMTARRKKSK